MAIKATDIIVRRVNDFLDGGVCQNVSERSDIRQSDSVDDVDFAAGGNLNQAELLRVMVEAVRFSIQGDDI